MCSSLLLTLRRQSFLTSPLSIIFSPVYIIRSGLYGAIRTMASEIGGDVLDFGCGSKPYESLFVNATTYVGVDIESSGHSHDDSKIDLFYDGSHLPFCDSTFDGVVSFEVLEHVFNIDQVLSEIHRVLKPNGLLLLSVPFAWDEHEVPFDFARYTSFGISHVLQSNGFKIVSSLKTTTYILAVFQLFIAYVYQHLLPRRGLIAKVARIPIVFPLNLVALLLDAILPSRYDYYCNNVILAKKA
jgi:SAM-dependent methyltransferase